MAFKHRRDLGELVIDGDAHDGARRTLTIREGGPGWIEFSMWQSRATWWGGRKRTVVRVSLPAEAWPALAEDVGAMTVRLRRKWDAEWAARFPEYAEGRVKLDPLPGAEATHGR